MKLNSRQYNYHIPDVRVGDILELGANSQICEFNMQLGKIDGRVCRASVIVGHEEPTSAVVLDKTEFSTIYYKILWQGKVWIVLLNRHAKLFRDGKQVFFYPDEGW